MPRLSFNANIGRKRIVTVGALDRRDTYSARNDMRGIIRNYRNFIKQVESVLPEVLLEALEPTFQKSIEYCPKDTGRMVKSGYLEITSFRGTPRVEIGYGLGGEPPYTAKQHENLEYRHKSPTRAKWLQVALEEDAGEIQRRIIGQLRV